MILIFIKFFGLKQEIGYKFYPMKIELKGGKK